MSYVVNSEKVIFADLDVTEAVVLNLDNKRYYRLNETGQIIWKALEKGQTPEQIAQELVTTYDINLHSAMNDVTSLIEHLKSEALVEDAQKATPIFSIEKAHEAKKNKTPF